MREGLDHWTFVTVAYLLTVAGTVTLTVWAWLAMRRAEARRDRSREG
jgi:hypothetical protein